MEFHECFTLLSTRPAAHAQWKANQEALEDTLDVQADDDSPTSLSASPKVENLTLQTPRELVETFNRLQAMRVQIFQKFRQGFHVYQKTAHFPAFCSKITERFAAVSEQINHIEKLLRDEKQQVAIAQLLRKIQGEEKEKLLVTSAVLIEKMRLSDAAKHPEPDHATIAFLERSVDALTSKHTDCVVRINEMLEELQAETADLEDA